MTEFAQRPDLRSFDKAILQRRNFPFVNLGDHVETEFGWGVIENITSHGAVVVSLFRYRDDPGKQDFPEWRFKTHRLRAPVLTFYWPKAPSFA